MRNNCLPCFNRIDFIVIPSFMVLSWYYRDVFLTTQRHQKHSLFTSRRNMIIKNSSTKVGFKDLLFNETWNDNDRDDRPQIHYALMKYLISGTWWDQNNSFFCCIYLSINIMKLKTLDICYLLTDTNFSSHRLKYFRIPGRGLTSNLKKLLFLPCTYQSKPNSLPYS